MSNQPWDHWHAQRRQSIRQYQTEIEDSLNAPRGILVALVICVGLWVLAGLIVYHAL